MTLIRRDDRPELGFLEIPYPADPPPLEPLEEHADGNARMSFAWGRARLWESRLMMLFPEIPPAAEWGVDVFEHEVFIGDWPEGDYEGVAVVTIGLLYDPADDEALDFAKQVRAEAPVTWGVD